MLEQIVALVEEGRQVRAGSEPPPLAAEGVVGGALAVIHARMHVRQPVQLTELSGPLMATIVLPYLVVTPASSHPREGFLPAVSKFSPICSARMGADDGCEGYGQAGRDRR